MIQYFIITNCMFVFWAERPAPLLIRDHAFDWLWTSWVMRLLPKAKCDMIRTVFHLILVIVLVSTVYQSVLRLSLRKISTRSTIRQNSNVILHHCVWQLYILLFVIICYFKQLPQNSFWRIDFFQHYHQVQKYLAIPLSYCVSIFWRKVS
jgi:hypothetical protein